MSLLSDDDQRVALAADIIESLPVIVIDCTHIEAFLTYLIC